MGQAHFEDAVNIFFQHVYPSLPCGFCAVLRRPFLPWSMPSWRWTGADLKRVHRAVRGTETFHILLVVALLGRPVHHLAL